MRKKKGGGGGERKKKKGGASWLVFLIVCLLSWKNKIPSIINLMASVDVKQHVHLI